MAHPDNVILASRFGLFMLAAGGLGLFTGTTLSRSGLVSRISQPQEFYVACFSHLAVGAFCYFAQFFVETAR